MPEPSAAVPVAVPVEVIDTAPVEKLLARMPAKKPVVSAAVIVIPLPKAELIARIPLPVVPVAAPLDVTDRAPVPEFRA